MFMWRPEVDIKFLPLLLLYYIIIYFLSVNLKLTDWFDWMVSEPQRSSCFFPLSIWNPAPPHTAFYVNVGNPDSGPRAYGKHFIH